jgi:hypothetical protein
MKRSLEEADATILAPVAKNRPSSAMRQSPFEMLPDEMLTEIARWLPDQPPSDPTKLSALSNYIGTAKRFHFLLQPQHILTKFLQYVVYGNQKQAEAILKDANLRSQLLQQKAQVIDYSGRTIYGTALQLALGAEDVKYHDDEECMTEMLKGYLKQLPNGDTLIAQQIAEQFPEGWEEKEKARAQRDLAALKTVICAIKNNQEGDNCDADIQAFRRYLDAENKSNVIKQGKHFNVQLLADAFNLYAEKYIDFSRDMDGMASSKNTLFWRKTIGYIERYVTACYAQALSQGVFTIVQNGDKLRRSLTFLAPGRSSFFPLDADPGFRLGEEAAVSGGSEFRGRLLPDGDWCEAGPSSARYYQKLCQTKNINSWNIIRRQAESDNQSASPVVK